MAGGKLDARSRGHQYGIDGCGGLADRYRMRLRSALLALIIAASACVPLQGYARDTRQPDAPAPAASTCPADTVVWVNTRSGVYHMPGMTWFGRTKEGTYMCRKDADRAGHRPTRNGQ